MFLALVIHHAVCMAHILDNSIGYRPIRFYLHFIWNISHSKKNLAKYCK